METVLSSSFLGAFAAREWQRTKPKRTSPLEKSSTAANRNPEQTISDAVDEIKYGSEHISGSERSNDTSLLHITEITKNDTPYSVRTMSGSLSARDWSPSTKEMASLRMPRHQLLEAMTRHEASMREVLKENSDLEKQIADLKSKLEDSQRSDQASKSSLKAAGIELNCLRSAINDCLQENKILESRVKKLQIQATDQREATEHWTKLQKEFKLLSSRLFEEQQARSRLQAENDILHLQLDTQRREATDRREENALLSRISELEQAHDLITRLQEERDALLASLARKDTDRDMQEMPPLSDANRTLRREVQSLHEVPCRAIQKSPARVADPGGCKFRI